MANEEKDKAPRAKKREVPAAEGSLTERVIAETEAEAPSLERLPELDVERERRQIGEMGEAAQEQAEAKIDRAVEEGTRQLQQAEEDAQAGFQAQRDQIAVDERQAMDSTALYAELRGDRGGIGQAQYASVQNTAALNRQRVGREQQRLATETAQRIEELRRQGEFQKADAVLELTQKQLSALLDLERWAKEKNLSVAEFNTELARWEAEYAWQLKHFGVQTELSLAQLTGTMPDGSPTLAAKQAERSRLAAAAKLLMEYGLTLTPEQLEALGWTEGQYEAFIEATAPEEEPPAGPYGPAPEEKDGEESEEAEDEGKDGKNREKPGAPFQLMGSWLAALRQSDDPISVLAQIRASQWYAKMSPSQRAQLAAVLSERGLA